MPPNHLISFFSGGKPEIVFWKGEAEETMQLEGEVALAFGTGKHCTGFRSRNSRHKCPYGYEGRQQCPFCGSKDIARIYTRHDFSGYEDLEEEFSKHEFSIYLASFGDIVKCGVTHSERIKERVREQGADYYAEVMRLRGKQAYEMESLLQSHFGFRNAVRATTKLKLLGQENPGALEGAISRMESCEPFNEYMLDAPMPQEIDYSLPKKWETSENIEGTILGAKGPLLFFESGCGARVINLKSKSGMFFSMD